VVLLACFCSAIGVRAAMSAYDKKLDLLSTIVEQDYVWRHLFLESVYYKLDRTYYARIIDDELLKNARHESFTTDGVQAATTAVADGGETSGAGETSGGGEASSSTPPEIDIRDRIIPYMFVRNIILKRYVVGSILDMGLDVLMLSFKCLLYKHMVHLITLIRVEMKRSKSQRKAASWSGKSKDVIESVLMTMGALQFTDVHVLATLSFFDIYKTNSKDMADEVKNEYSKQLSERSDKMLEYVNDVCVVRPKDDEDKSMEEQVAEMIGVYKVDLLYNTGASFADSPHYKKMIKSSRAMIDVVFGSTPRVKGMSKFIWHDILHFQENSKLKA